jgi:hypothetical protein
VSLSRPPVQVVAHSTFVERLGEANVGDGRAPSSTTSFYLSRGRRLGRGAIRLVGTARVRPLSPGRLRRVAAWLTVPASTPAHSYFLVACADIPGTVKERNRHNDCRVAARRIAVRSAGGSGGSGGPGGGGGSGGPGNAVTPCIPTRHPTLSSSGATCFDGDAADGIFVSAIGDDQNPGTMAAPKRTLGAGVTRALALKGRDLYVTEGVYPEVLSVVNGISVYGGYDVSWHRSPSNLTKITGSGGSFYMNAALATDVTAATTVQLVTLVAGPALGPGGTSYGVRGTASPGLVLDHVSIRAAAGTAGGSGADGAKGADGGNGGSGVTLGSDGNLHAGLGGTSAGGHPGGEGAFGGFDGESGSDGAPGQSIVPDSHGGMGGAGGLGGAGGSNPGTGLRGLAGDFGYNGADGAGGGTGDAVPPANGLWFTRSGQDGQSGTAGHGSGGGGGGGSDGCTVFGSKADGGLGGGGGGGGAGGGGGKGGQGGGGSFGIFLVNSAGALVRDSSVTASNGGAGGTGGHCRRPRHRRQRRRRHAWGRRQWLVHGGCCRRWRRRSRCSGWPRRRRRWRRGRAQHRDLRPHRRSRARHHRESRPRRRGCARPRRRRRKRGGDRIRFERRLVGSERRVVGLRWWRRRLNSPMSRPR